ncbi:MAG: hypothetical protein ACR2M4_04455 [Actinomycetota bacterium]
MSRRAGRRFESHLLSCEQCWSEVARARRGREAAESARELAPQGLSESIRALVLSQPAVSSNRRFLRIGGAVTAMAIIAAGALVVSRRADSPSPLRQPESVAQALTDFADGRIPAVRPASRPAPDLTQIGFAVTAAGSGRVGAIAVDGFSYRDPAGRRLQLYLSEQPFPEAAGARRFSRPDGPWMASSRGVELLCAEQPWPLLALSRNPEVLTELTSFLRIA